MRDTMPRSYTLLRRSPLLPGESLGSLLARLARLNGYETLYTVMLLVLPELSGRRNYKHENWDNLARPFRARTYERLAALTKLDPLELYNATEHSFGTTVMPPDQEMQTIYLQESESDLQALPIVSNRHVHLHFYTAATAQYCPLCLREDATPYHRLIWSARAIAACTRHEVLLINECVVCHSNIRIRDVAVGCCPTCKADLASVSPHSVAGDQLGLLTQTTLRTWLLGGHRATGEGAQSLPNTSTRALFRVVYGLATSAWYATSDWSFQHRMPTGNTAIKVTRGATLVATPEHQYRIFATAMKALLDWPTGFYSFLSTYRDQRRDRRMESGKGKTDVAGFITYLGALSGKWMLRDWQGTEFDFVQEAFASYLVDNQVRFPRVDIAARHKDNPAQKNKFEYMSLREAARVLALARTHISKLLDAGFLRGETSVPAGTRTYHLVSKADVQSLAGEWKKAGLLHHAHAAKLLGVDWRHLDTLRRAGLLTPARGPKLDGFPLWIYSQEAIRKCQRWLAANTAPLPSSVDIAAVAHTTIILWFIRRGRGGIKALFQAVESGHVRAYLHSKRPSKPPMLYFDMAEIRAHFGIATNPRKVANP
jgi:hypothetical protein